jgi:hypothetical protein
MNNIKLQLAHQDFFLSSKEQAWRLPNDKNGWHILNPGKKSALSILVFMLITMFFGCASDKAADVQLEETRHLDVLLTKPQMFSWKKPDTSQP